VDHDYGYVSIYKNCEDNITEDEQWGNSTLTEKDCHTLRRIVSKDHTSTAAQVTTELNIHPEDPVSTKTV
jgi:hypothetical protein